ncbi:MAG: lipid-A-disaccharide synthase [Nitrospirota bacterium]|nr:lipid-A-disaccharide synthase [Nitrospirota bacterium]
MSTGKSKKILIIAGEASGDLHGANLVRELKHQDPSLAVFGVGSRRMSEAGVEMLADARDISVVGATEVLTHLGAIYRVYARLKGFIRTSRPDLLILIDFPDFNILVGKFAKKLGIPVLYYVSPQVWAWRKGRIKTIANLVKVMMVLFPFEVELYRKAGVDVRFVGHPLVDSVTSSFSCAEAKNFLGMDPARRTVALLPGSRTKEITSLLPDMLESARILLRRFPELQFVLPVAPTLERSFVKEFIDQSGIPVTLSDGRTYDVLRASDAAIVTSGTATLETGLMEVPMVIVYRISELSYAIGKMIIDVQHIGLVNIVAGRTIVPELIQDKATPEAIASAISDVLDDPERYAQMKSELGRIRTLLGASGASKKAAAVVHEVLGAAL